MRKKTKKSYQIPMLDTLFETLSPRCISKGIFLPVPSNVKYNTYLKEIADIAGVIKHLTTHLARKTFASTIMLANGVNIRSIKQTSRALIYPSNS